MTERYKNRVEAGQLLAQQLMHYANRSDVIILALPRGGVPVGYEVAKALHAPLDIFVVRKLGVPGQEELAMGAVASGGKIVLNEELMHHLALPQPDLDKLVERELAELKRRESKYRADHPAPDVHEQVVILVDDGLATGSSMRAAAEALQLQQPKRIVVAVPVAPLSTCDEFRAEVDEVVCAQTPDPFYAVGMWYEDFEQTTDEQVRTILQEAARLHPVG